MRSFNSSIFYLLENNHLAFLVGKYKDRSLEGVARDDPDYLRWFLTQDLSATDKECIRAAIEPEYVGSANK